MDMSRLNQPIGKDSSYNERMREEALKKQVTDRVNSALSIVSDYKNGWASGKYRADVLSYMDFVEKILHACGGERKANFLDVSEKFIKIATRVPMSANLHPMLPEDAKDNPRYHKVVTQILLDTPLVSGVKWIPNEAGTLLLITLH